MYQKPLTLLLLICCMASSYASTQYITPKKNNRPIATTTTLPPFSALRATGPVQVILTCQLQNQGVTLIATPKVSSLVNLSVQKRTLLIEPHLPMGQYSAPVVRVDMNQPLRQLEASGTANVQALYCGNPNLVLIAKDDASIYLKGTNTLRAIQNDSTNAVTVENIRGKNFLLGSTRHGKITLSGQTDELDTKIQGSALLDAKRLQARSAHILTRDSAVAYVSVREVLYGFAYDYSNIYYYGRPQRVMKETSGSGNVLAVKALSSDD